MKIISYTTLTTNLIILLTIGFILPLHAMKDKKNDEVHLDLSLIKDRFDILSKDNGVICSDFHTLLNVASKGRGVRLNPTITVQSNILSSSVKQDLTIFPTWQLEETPQENDEKEKEFEKQETLIIDFRTYEMKIINSQINKMWEEKNIAKILRTHQTFVQRNCYLVSFSTLCIGIAGVLTWQRLTPYIFNFLSKWRS